MTVADLADSEIPTLHRHRWLIPAGVVWTMGVLVWFMADSLLPQSDQSKVVGLTIVLASLGLIGAAAMSRELSILTALARLKLGPWMAIGFSLGFGFTTLTWLGDQRLITGS